jgi:hypothetical protein
MSRASSLLNPLNKGHGAAHDLYLNVSLQLVAEMFRDIPVAERFSALVARILCSSSSIYSWISDSEAIFVSVKPLGRPAWFPGLASTSSEAGRVIARQIQNYILRIGNPSLFHQGR